MTTDKTKRIADALRAYYRSEHSAPVTLMHAADLIEQLQRDLDNAQAGESIAQMAAPRAQEPSPTAGMNIAQRILHVGGRNNAAGYVEFGSIQAVQALVNQVLRDLPASAQEPATAPHQPLTDEQIRNMWFAAVPTEDGRPASWNYARAIERAHGIGTEGGAA